MKCKKDLLSFLNDNYTMINSLMSQDERKTFNGDVTKVLVDGIKKEIESEEK